MSPQNPKSNLSRTVNNTPSTRMKQLHVNIPDNLHKKFRLKVIEEGSTMNHIIEKLINDYVSKV